jgi:hypothetical protein
VNEFGQDTRNVFFKMALDIEALKRMDAQSQFTMIAAALARMNQSAGASAAGMIFGREGAQQMMQLAASTNDFATAIGRSAQDAQTWQRVSDSFEKFEIKMRALKEEAGVFFADIAGKLMPLFDKAGAFAMALRNAFEGGHLGELLALSIRVGLDDAVPYVEAFAKALGAALLDVIKHVGPAIAEIIGGSIDADIADSPKMIAGLLKARKAQSDYSAAMQGVQAAKDVGDKAGAEQMQKQADEARQRLAAANQGLSDLSKAHEATTDAIINDALGKMAGMNPMQAYLDNYNVQPNNSPSAVLDRLRFKRQLELAGIDWDAVVGGQAGGAGGAGGTGGGNLLMKGSYKPEFTALEKMGFVMGGAGNPLVDLTRSQLSESRRQTSLLTTISSMLGGSGAAPMTNQV